MIADRVIRLVLNLFVAIVVARYLGPENFGVWNYLLSFTMFFIPFVGMGLESVIPRELVNHPEKEKPLMATSFMLSLISGFTGYGLSILIFSAYKEQSHFNIIMMSIMASLLIFKATEMGDVFFKAKLQAKYAVISRNLAFVLVAALKVYFVYFEYALVYFVATNALEMLLGGILVFTFYVRNGNDFRLKDFDLKLAKHILKDGLPLALSGFLIVLYMRIDQVMLTDMKGDVANGIYSTSVRMIEIVYFIPFALSEAFFPGIVYSKKHEGEKYTKNILGFYSIFTFLSLTLMLGIFLVAKPMMLLFFGDEFIGSGAALQILGLTLYFFFLSVATGRFLLAENYKIIILVRSLAGLISNVALNLLLIPRYGFLGAAYASLISYAVPLIVLVFFDKSRGQFRLMLHAFNPRVLANKIKSNE
jgi:PST family polysaccharide transporter